MNTRLLMSFSALFTGLIGIATSFAPDELLDAAGIGGDPRLAILLKTGGALYLGYAAMNWAGRAVLIGGIYSRPLALGNFFHFGIAAVVLGKAILDDASVFLAAILLPYAALAAGFAYVLFAFSPVRPADSD